MDPRRVFTSEGGLAGAWLLFVGIYSLLVFQFVSPKPWTDGRFSAWVATSYLAEFLVVVLFVLALAYLWTGTDSMLGGLLGGLILFYAPLHLSMSRGLFAGSELHGVLAHYRQPFYPVLTILSVALLARAVLYRNGNT